MAAAEKDAPTQTVAADDTMGGGLSAVAIRRPIFTMMIMLGLIVLGIFSYRRLSIDQFPSVDIPIVVVQTTYPGASAETIEREVTERMEQAFNPVEGVDRITSQSLEGVSLVVIEFELERNSDVASQDIRSKIERSHCVKQLSYSRFRRHIHLCQTRPRLLLAKWGCL